MLEKLIQTMQEEVHAKKLYTLTKEISSYHRIQGSPMYRKAAKHCMSLLEDMGIEATLHSFPIKKDNYAGPYKLFEEWNCNDAYLDLVYPQKKQLANFKIEPTSIIQKSIPCDYRNTPLEVIHMQYGNEEKAYKNIDFQNKMVFIHEDFHSYEWVLEKGAVGFISDFIREVPHVRTRADLYDAINYTSFWWKNSEEEKKAFGFVLSPREGDALRALCDNTQEAYEEGKLDSPYLKVCPYVDSSLYEGNIEVVEGVLPGKSEESILITAHLCHPCASANDNASGCASALSCLYSIKNAIDKGKLPPLEKTIRMILVPEFTGTYCYLEKYRKTHSFVSGINLDMVGAKQEDTTGPITITCLPHALASFEDMLAKVIFQSMPEYVSSKETLEISHVKTAVVPFGLGSDHCILSDPMIHIPAIMLGQWPDKYYHTSLDTLERIDPIVLKFSTVFASVYTYALANTCLQEEITQEVLSSCFKDLQKADQTQYRHLCHYYKKILSILPISETQQALFDDMIKQYPSINPCIKDKRIYKRRFDMSINDINDVIVYDKNKKTIWKEYTKTHPNMQEGYGLAQTLCEYYCDGTRCVDEIAEEVIAELHQSAALKQEIRDFFHVMEKLELFLLV